MAIVDSGTIGGLPTVEKCLGLHTLSEKFGLHELSRLPNGQISPAVPSVRIGETDFEFYRHPLLFINDTAKIWKEENAALEYSEKKRYDDYHPCFIYAKSIYDNLYNALKPKPQGLL